MEIPLSGSKKRKIGNNISIRIDGMLQLYNLESLWRLSRHKEVHLLMLKILDVLL